MIYFLTDRLGRPIAMTGDPFGDGPASCDTLPKGQDAKQGLAGTEGGAVGSEADETPKEAP